MATEQRRFSRIRFATPVQVQVGRTVYSVNQLANLSIGGCQLEIESSSLSAGAECLVRIALLPEDRRMDVVIGGKIVRSEGPVHSIQFLSIDPESLHHLQNILRYNFADPDRIEDEIGEHPGLV